MGAPDAFQQGNGMQFCPTCGTRLFHRVLGQSEILSIKPGTLNDKDVIGKIDFIGYDSHDFPPQLR